MCETKANKKQVSLSDPMPGLLLISLGCMAQGGLLLLVLSETLCELHMRI